MDRKRGIRTVLALVAVAVALGAVWLGLGGFRDNADEPFPVRTAGQSEQPSSTQTDPPQASSSAPTTAASSGSQSEVDPVSGLPWVALSALPPEVADTLEAIEAGPPYPYQRDGVTFENREGLLPDEEYGYYQEFTVTTPGSSDRGPRRVIWGLQDELYFTADHYQSFERIQR